jgi:hypothetical protein
MLALLVAARVASAPSASSPEPSCGSLGPSEENDSTARVGSLFERPTDLAQLLQNVKVAYEKNLFIQPALYSDANLETFFAATGVEWGNPKPLGTS